jgi:hypothetical protein
LQVEDLVGWLAGDARAMFSFQWIDEMDAVDGAETITLKDECLILKLMCHNGDDFTFECECQR